MKEWIFSVSDNGRALEELQGKLDYTFSNPRLLTQALKHRSYVYKKNECRTASNERLEFLGDAVLDLVVTENLFRRFKTKREGDLTQIKSLLVSKVVLAEKGRDLSLGQYLYLSKEETQAGGRNRTSIIGDAFEALLGAIYLDGGLLAAQKFLIHTLLLNTDEIIANGDYLNFKSVLLEHTQSEKQSLPRYFVNSVKGPDHRKFFTVEVIIEDKQMGIGTGRSKKEAQQMAAKEALKRLGLS